MSQTNPILEELRPLEPIFHTASFGLTAADREHRMAAGYWEIGASGRRYTRDFILTIDQSHFIDADTAGWITADHAVHQLGPTTYLVTYTLLQDDRLSRRATIWQKSANGWIILYHQGTLIASNPDDIPCTNS